MIEKTARHYGINHQSRQAIEEMAELTQALTKFWNYKTTRKEKYGMKNIVQVIHQEFGTRFAFECPLDVKLKKGEIVCVNTRRGNTIATCVSDSVMMSDEMIDMMMWGKKVTGKVLGKYEYKEF